MAKKAPVKKMPVKKAPLAISVTIKKATPRMMKKALKKGAC